MDQTGVHLVPSSSFTYESNGSKSVEVLGADDKRQITACIASSLDGQLLPLQIIFDGKTPRSTPKHTLDSTAARVHITHSENHWSTQETMKAYIEKVILPYATRAIELHQLRADANILLVLDVWSVHKSKEFRDFLQQDHPRIHLVFVPANCTSKLQVADVMLQRPFKAEITRQFNNWAASEIYQQITNGHVIGLQHLLQASKLKPLALQWCINSWKGLASQKEFIIKGWEKCCTSLYDVNDPIRRNEAMITAAARELTWELEEVEAGSHQIRHSNRYDSAFESDSDDDELDLSQPISQGLKGARIRKQTMSFGYQLDSSAIAMSEDSN